MKGICELHSTRELNYSNPDVEIKNEPTGTNSDNDVARKIREEAQTVEAFRDYTPPLSVYISEPTKGDNAGTYTWYASVENNEVVSARYTTFCCDGDVVEDRYIVLDNDTNYIELTTINSETGEIKGNFEVTLVRDPDDDVTNASLPDTINFTNGNFHTKVLDDD